MAETGSPLHSAHLRRSTRLNPDSELDLNSLKSSSGPSQQEWSPKSNESQRKLCGIMQNNQKRCEAPAKTPWGTCGREAHINRAKAEGREPIAHDRSVGYDVDDNSLKVLCLATAGNGKQCIHDRISGYLTCNRAEHREQESFIQSRIALTQVPTSDSTTSTPTPSPLFHPNSLNRELADRGNRTPSPLNIAQPVYPNIIATFDQDVDVDMSDVFNNDVSSSPSADPRDNWTPRMKKALAVAGSLHNLHARFQDIEQAVSSNTEQLQHHENRISGHDGPASLQKSYEARLERLLKSYNQLSQDLEQQKSLWGQEIDELRLSPQNPQNLTSLLDDRSRQFLNKVSVTHDSFAKSTIHDLNALRQQVADQDAATQGFEDLKLNLNKVLLEQSRNKSIVHDLVTQMRTFESNIKDLQQDSIVVPDTESAERTRKSELRELKVLTKAQERQIADLIAEQDQEREANRARVEAMEKKLCLIRTERNREREATLVRFETLEEKLSAIQFGTQLTSFATNIDREQVRHLELSKQQQQKQHCKLERLMEDFIACYGNGDS